jgi:hypothetical protein
MSCSRRYGSRAEGDRHLEVRRTTRSGSTASRPRPQPLRRALTARVPKWAASSPAQFRRRVECSKLRRAGKCCHPAYRLSTCRKYGLTARRRAVERDGPAPLPRPAGAGEAGAIYGVLGRRYVLWRTAPVGRTQPSDIEISSLSGGTLLTIPQWDRQKAIRQRLPTFSIVAASPWETPSPTGEADFRCPSAAAPRPSRAALH